MRHYTFFDKCCLQFDAALRTLSGSHLPSERVYPANTVPESSLTSAEKRHSAGFMRVNHVGEVCAQALYQGQAITARDLIVREKMQAAGHEEIDHLLWCEYRLKELGSHTSYLNPLWYLGSFSLGLLAGMVGDHWSLGFVAETEKQVTAHLDNHLQALPMADRRSRAIVQVMRDDEICHAQTAISMGAAEFSRGIKTLMRYTAKIMTTTAYYF